MNHQTNPEAFAPGEYIREEIEVRGWTQLDLAEILGRPPQAVSEIITGKRSITTDTAMALGDAFGTSAQVWLNLESSYQLSRISGKDDSVSRKAKLYEIAPLKDMQRRGWIETSSNIDVLEAQVLNFYDIKSLSDPIYFHHAARKSTDYSSITPGQLAWLYRCRRLAKGVPVTRKFSSASFDACLKRLSSLRAATEEIRHIPEILSHAGIRFLIVEPLPQTSVDGVCFWLDTESPVIALSLRFDRIDYFWHTLMHEMKHVKEREGMEQPTIDMNLVGSDAQPFEDKSDSEKAADTFAIDFLVNQQKLSEFVIRVRPLFSKAKIAAFAAKQHVHPGIVVGQLHHKKTFQFRYHRDFLEKIKEIITEVSLTDGWGHSKP
ncbi:MAG TPA: HigA family addiction module antitoxin [Bryobacteraceae bacterium]|nr:HigA family addiction module antitoxin [Bryobacteraceae bacterium]